MPNSGRCSSAYPCTAWDISSRLDDYDADSFAARRTLQHMTASRSKMGDVTRAALVLTHFKHGYIT